LNNTMCWENVLEKISSSSIRIRELERQRECYSCVN